MSSRLSPPPTPALTIRTGFFGGRWFYFPWGWPFRPFEDFREMALNPFRGAAFVSGVICSGSRWGSADLTRLMNSYSPSTW